MFECSVNTPACFAVVDEKTFLVGESGKPALRQLDYTGKCLQTVPLPEEPLCVAVAKSGQLFAGRYVVASKNSIAVYTPDGKNEKTFKLPDSEIQNDKTKSNIRSLIIADDSFYAADSGWRSIYRFDADGNVLSTFGKKTADSETSQSTAPPFDGFVVYAAPITMTLSPKTGLLHIANPGRHRVETFTPDGIYEPALSWGEATGGLDGFVGCCNPADIVALPDGRIMTVEKSVLRIKIFKTDRQLDCVVAGPGILEHYPKQISQRPRIEPGEHYLLADILPDERIAVFDLNWNLCRIFVRR